MIKLQDDKDSGRERFRKIKLQEDISFRMTKLQDDKASGSIVQDTKMT
jgi:hypothetical protein